MDSIPTISRAYTAAEWKQSWEFSPRVPKVAGQLATRSQHSCQETVFRAAYFAAGKLHDDGFTLLHNGGQPLLKRYRGDWIDELLFHSPPTGVAGAYSPVSIEIIVSLRSLEELRVKYSRSCMMVPTSVSTMNLGSFEEAPCQVLWNVEHPPIVEEIAQRLHDEGLDWVDQLSDLETLETAVTLRQLRGVDDATGLELVMSLLGKVAARRVVHHWQEDLTMGPRLDRASQAIQRTFGPVYRSDDPTLNLAVICQCHDLLTMFRLT